MLSGKYVSCQEVIRRAYRDKKYTYELPWQDAVEWCAEAIDKIGAPLAYQPRQVRVTIQNHRGMLPCGLHDITQAAGSFNGCTPFPMVTKTNTFGPVFTCADQPLPTMMGEVDQNGFLQEVVGYDISGNPVYNTPASGGNSPTGNFAFPKNNTRSNTGNLTSEATYHLSDNFIFTNFSDGFVMLAYDSLPVDKDGFPLIPDKQSYIDAVKAYICFMIDSILCRAQELDEKWMNRSEVDWLWYVSKAGNDARMPSYDGMQALMNQMKLIPTKYSHDKFFVNLGKK